MLHVGRSPRLLDGKLRSSESKPREHSQMGAARSVVAGDRRDEHNKHVRYVYATNWDAKCVAKSA